MLSTLGIKFQQKKFGFFFFFFFILFYLFFFFFQKTGFDISCKLSPVETICMKCQILFSGKNKKILSVCCLLN